MWFLVLASCGREKQAQSTPSPRAPAELSAKVDRAAVSPGDIITFTMTANYAPDVSLELPDVADRFADFLIVNSGVSPIAEKGDRLILERWYKFQSDTAGSYVIEPIEVSYVPSGSSQQVLRTPKIFIEVVSLLGKEGQTEDIRDIKPPLPVTLSYRVLLRILAMVVGVLAAVLLIRWLVGWLRRRAEARESISRLPHEEALDALERLLKKRLIEKGRAREFCFEISEIFRQYMHARFGIPAVDWTTDEILPHIDDDGLFEEAIKSLVREFLTDTDMVKFARYQPPREDLERIVEDTRTFVNRTKMVEADENGGEREGNE